MQEAEPYDASMLIPMNFTTLTSCWFNLRESTRSNKGSNTNQWSLTAIRRQSGPITTGAPVPSTTVATVLPSTSSAAASSVASPRATSNDDLSPGAKAGLGIGVGIGTSLVCAGLFWLYYRHVKRKEHHQEVYRRIVGEQGGAPGAGQEAYPTTNEHLEPWRYGGTPQPAPSAAISAYSGASDSNSTDWYPSRTPSNAPYQYYDPVGTNYQAAAAPAHYQYQPPPPTVITTASMTAEPPSSIVRGPSSSTPPRAEHVPEAAAIRDVRDLSSSLYPSEYNNEPVSPVSADRDDTTPPPPPRVSSVNYGPMGRLDASTGADFTLLPDYTSPDQQGQDGEDDLYGPPTPRSPPPPHSAHAHVAGQHLQQQEQQHVQAAQEQAWQTGAQGASAEAVELPTAQTHRGHGPRAELPAGDAAQPALRQQRSDLRGPEQKFLLGDTALGQQRSDLRGPEQKVLLQDMAPLRTEQHRDGG